MVIPWETFKGKITMKQYYVYMTINLIDNKKYIGQHYGELNDNYLGSGSTLKKAIKKYGAENFKKEILKICNNPEELDKAEIELIDKYNAVESDEFYNIAVGGHIGYLCKGLSEEADRERRRKLSIANSGEKNYFYGKHFCGEEHPMYGKHHSEESKKRMSEAKKGEKSPTARGVVIYDLDGNFIKSFGTQKELKIFLGLSPNGSTDTLHKYIKNSKPYHGYIVKFL